MRPASSPRSVAIAATALTLVVMLLTGCTAPAAPAEPTASAPRVPLAEVAASTDPKAYVGLSTATLDDAAIEPVAASPTSRLPVTVTSHDLSGEVEVTVTNASRVIAMDLSGSLAATVAGLGFADRLVGRDISTTFAGVGDLPVITSGGHSVNAEAIIGLAPTLVITDGSIGPADVVQQLRDVGITVVFVERSSSFAGAVAQAHAVAAVFGAADAGDLLAARIDSELQAVTAQISRIAPAAESERLRMVFLYLRGTSGISYLFGSESGADDLIGALGGIDVAGQLGWRGMQPMTDEAMVAADPDLILVMTAGIASVGGIDGLLAEKPAIALTTAGQHRRFVDMADGQILSFGPRSAEVLDALARAIYAPGATPGAASPAPPAEQGP